MAYKKLFLSTLAGALFALGLVISGMTQPAKVIGFLHLAGLAQGISWHAAPGYWDPSLALVMGGALMVSLLAFTVTPQAAKPWLDAKFHLPTRQDIDKPLIIGSALFGMGWGIAGFCPGPGLASLLAAGSDAAWFVAAMVTGMWLTRRLTKN